MLRFLPLIIAAGATLTSPYAWGWGAIGHRMVAETAALLIQDELPRTWGPLLDRYRFELGYYAYAPDSIYRHKDATGEREGPTHYFDLDLLLPAARDDLPPTYAEARAKLTPQLKRKDIAFEKLGSSPWRVGQFLRLATESLRGVQKAEGPYQRGRVSTGDTRRIFRGLYLLGILAHYTGDATMPYHATEDWDALSEGHGGIHFYFEIDCVNELEPGLAAAVLGEARKRRRAWLQGWKAAKRGPVELMAAIYADSLEAIPRLSKLDREHVITQVRSPGSETPATRAPARKGCPPLKDILVERIAKAAVLTAHLWSRALPPIAEQKGPVPLQFSDFEHDPEFIPPDY